MPSIPESLGLDKLIKFGQTIKKIGGVRAALKKRYLTDQTRVGELVGEDKFGNRYYKDDTFFMPRNRWVEFPEQKWLDYDASQVPPEWHRWLHHISDEPPTVAPPPEHKWVLEHKENTSLYADAKYIPYSTTRPKIQGWQPGQKQ